MSAAIKYPNDFVVKDLGLAAGAVRNQDRRNGNAGLMAIRHEVRGAAACGVRA
jgi:hypothetical protein